ncbi:MAG: cysteine desulfurase NifS [Actinobacteria bacterium RBG_16_64_13]|nr:MAG: cysteine desulfurase NifS [Actinobacteria bacterium RBG_16_64_13]
MNTLAAPVTGTRPIYLDYNATTPVLPEVLDAMLPFLGERFGNPSSLHPYGREARSAVEQARVEVALLLGCSPEEIIFTSGGTESNNLAILGSIRATACGGDVLTSVIEHPAVSRPCELLEGRGSVVTRLGVDELGVVDVEEARKALDHLPLLLTVMHANNETGTIQPIREIADVARERGALVHTDAAQSVGKVPVDVDDLGVDLLSVAGHKLYAPKGVGALYVRRGVPLRPVLVGAGHERGLRPGTENVASIAGLGAACALARNTLQAESTRVMVLRDRLWNVLSEGVPGLKLNGHPLRRLPNTLNVVFPGVRSSRLLETAVGVAASGGSACHEGGETPSPVLTAMGVARVDALGAVRLSLGRGTTEVDVAVAAEALVAAWRVLKGTPAS